MSNIYIQEPPTNGKVLLKTTVSDIDIELWSKEAPLTCRNFIQLCMEGYYNDCIFHRLIKNFIVQTGDPTGTGFGGESIYGKPFKDEFHSRLRFTRRGLVAMANNGDKDNNGSQFFFTFDSAPELQNKNTIFGKVTGKTLYNMLRLGEGEVDRHERPLYPHKIIFTEILNNPFPDIKPREKPSKKIENKQENRKVNDNNNKSKNFSLLSFGNEAEEEEEEVQRISSLFKNKSKSSHDLLKDDRLSCIPVVDQNELNEENGVPALPDENELDKRKRFNRVKEKLSSKNKFHNAFDNIDADGEIDDSDFFQEEKQQKKNREIESAKEEFQKLKKELFKDIRKEKTKEKVIGKNIAVVEFTEEANKFKEMSQQIKKKNQGREEQCWDLFQKFKKDLQKLKQPEQVNSGENEDKRRKNAWLNHRMNCTSEDEIVLARDANIRNEEDWYDIYDPRNPINKRRRNE